MSDNFSSNLEIIESRTSGLDTELLAQSEGMVYRYFRYYPDLPSNYFGPDFVIDSTVTLLNLIDSLITSHGGLQQYIQNLQNQGSISTNYGNQLTVLHTNLLTYIADNDLVGFEQWLLGEINSIASLSYITIEQEKVVRALTILYAITGAMIERSGLLECDTSNFCTLYSSRAYSPLFLDSLSTVNPIYDTLGTSDTVEQRGNAGCIIQEIGESLFAGYLTCIILISDMVASGTLTLPPPSTPWTFCGSNPLATPILFIGATMEIFEAPSDCRNEDCHAPSSISISSSIQCDNFTRTFSLNGVGEGALRYEWSTNGIPATAVTNVPFLTVTALDQNDLIITAGPVCVEEGAGGIGSTELWRRITTSFNIEAINEDIGPAMIISDSGQTEFKVGEVSKFIMHGISQFNQTTHQISMSPTIGSISDNGNSSFDVTWFGTGNATIFLTVTNVCSNKQENASISVTVTN